MSHKDVIDTTPKMIYLIKFTEHTARDFEAYKRKIFAEFEKHEFGAILSKFCFAQTRKQRKTDFKKDGACTYTSWFH